MSEAIVSHPKICKVLVVDDSSSEGDRAAMRAEFPAFEFVMKVSWVEKGLNPKASSTGLTNLPYPASHRR